MDKELQMTKQGGELVTTSTRAKLKKVILDEVSSIEIVMRALYSRCIRQLSISTVGSNDVLGEHISYQTCIMLLTTCKHGKWKLAQDHET